MTMLLFQKGTKQKVIKPIDTHLWIFDRLCETMENNYLGFNARAVNWKEHCDQFRIPISKTKQSTELIMILKKMLEPLKDSNVKIFSNNKLIFTSDPIINLGIEDELFQPQLIKEVYLKNNFLEGKGYVIGFIKNSSIAYVHLKWIGNNTLILQHIINSTNNSNGLILDLRHNMGGDISCSEHLLGNFTIEENQAFTTTSYIFGKLKTIEWKISPGRSYFDKPIVILTDYYTRGDAEKMIMFFKNLPNVKQIGGPTNGSPSSIANEQLNPEIRLTYSNQLVKASDGNYYEGIGLSPDIYIKNQLSEILNKKDKTLERAIKEFKL